MSSPESVDFLRQFDTKLRVAGSRNGQIQTNCEDKNGRIALAVACQFGNEDAVRDFLEHRAFLKCMTYDSDFMQQIQETLHYHTAFNSVVPAEEPIRSKILELVEGRTPLSLAVEDGNTAIVRMLLEHGEDVNEKDTERGGMTPILWAACDGHLEIVDLLGQSEANIEAVNIDGHTPLVLAARKLHAKVVDLLLQKYNAKVDISDSHGNGPLVVVAKSPAPGTEEKSAQRNIMKRLLEAGCDIDARDEHMGRTALVIASANDNVGLMKLLLEQGANVDAEGPYGIGALAHAAALRNLNMVKLLLDHNARFDLPGLLKMTPLEHALMPKHELVEDLRHTGEHNLLLILEMLLKAKPDSLMTEGSNSMAMALSSRNLKVLKLLLKYPGSDRKEGPINMPPPCYAAHTGKDAAIQVMIERGVSVNETDGRLGAMRSFGQSIMVTELYLRDCYRHLGLNWTIWTY